MQEDLDRHLRSAARSRTPAGRGMGARLFDACWPSGGADAFRTSAAAWLSRWRPEKLGAQLPACTCRAGRCAICN